MRSIVFVTAARGPLVAAAAAFVLGGCVAHEPLSDLYTGPQELPPALAERFDYPPGIPEADEEGLRKRPRFVVREIVLPGEDGEPLEIEYYDHGDSAEPRPVVVVLPIFSGQPIVTRYFARYFAQRG